MGLFDSREVIELRGKNAELTATVEARDREIKRLGDELATLRQRAETAEAELRATIHAVLHTDDTPHAPELTAEEQLRAAVAGGGVNATRLARIRERARQEWQAKQAAALRGKQEAQHEGFVA